MWNYVIESVLLVMIFLICVFHAAREMGNQPPVSEVFHGFWFGIYAVFAIVATIISHSWWMMLAAALLRGIAYNPLLNWLRGEKFFYVHGGSVNGSEFDKVLEKIGGFYPFLWALAVVAFGYVQTKL